MFALYVIEVVNDALVNKYDVTQLVHLLGLILRNHSIKIAVIEQFQLATISVITVIMQLNT